MPRGFSVTTVTAVTKKRDMAPPPSYAKLRGGYAIRAGSHTEHLRNSVGGHCPETGYSGYSGYGRLIGRTLEALGSEGEAA